MCIAPGGNAVNGCDQDGAHDRTARVFDERVFRKL
jgi:hypothetical protein